MKLMKVVETANQCLDAYAEILSIDTMDLKDHMHGFVLFILGQKEKTLPAELHDIWLYMKLTDGWKYSDELTLDQKASCLIVPFLSLPREYQNLYAFMIHVIDGLTLDGVSANEEQR